MNPRTENIAIAMQRITKQPDRVYILWEMLHLISFTFQETQTHLAKLNGGYIISAYRSPQIRMAHLMLMDGRHQGNHIPSSL